MLTCEIDFQQVILVQLLPVQDLHSVAQLGGVGTEGALHFVQRVGHGVDRIHHKHDLGFLLVVAAVDGQVLVAGAPVVALVLEAALELLLPEVPEPGVAVVVVGVEALEIAIKRADPLRGQLQGDGAVGHVLAALDDALLRAPAVAGHPGEGGVGAAGGGDELPRVVPPHEEDHDARVGLLQQLADHAVVGLADVGAPHLLGRGDADVAQAGFLLERLDPRLPVVALRGHRGHVGPVEETQDLGHGFGLVEVRGHGPGEVVIAGFVAEFGAGGGVADLRDLEEPEQVCHLKEGGRESRWFRNPGTEKTDSTRLFTQRLCPLQITEPFPKLCQSGSGYWIFGYEGAGSKQVAYDLGKDVVEN